MSALFPVIRLWTNLSTNFPMTFFIIIIIIIIIILGVFFGYISNAIPKFPHTPPLPYPPTPTSWPWCSPVLRHIKFARPMGLSLQWWLIGHLLLHMQLETGALGVLVISYCCSTYRVTDPFSSLDTFSSSSIGGLCSIQYLTVSIHFCVC
jgi:hypothetical protein